MENPTLLSKVQKVAPDKLTASLGPDYVKFLVSQGPEVLTARVEGFFPDEEARPRPLRVEFKKYSGKEGENLILWVREIEMAMRSGLIKLDHQQVSLAISKLDAGTRMGLDV